MLSTYRVLDLTEETARWRVFKARQRLLNVLSPKKVESPITKDE